MYICEEVLALDKPFCVFADGLRYFSEWFVFNEVLEQKVGSIGIEKKKIRIEKNLDCKATESCCYFDSNLVSFFFAARHVIDTHDHIRGNVFKLFCWILRRKT